MSCGAAPASQALEQRAAAVEDVDGVAARLQQRLQVLGEGRVVVDDGESRGSHAQSGSCDASPTARVLPAA